MKRIRVLILLLLVSGCTSYPESESITCTNSMYLFEDLQGEDTTTYFAENDYIIRMETEVRVPMDGETQKIIDANFGGNRERFIQEITRIYYLGTEKPREEFIDLGSELVLEQTIISPERPSDWRGLLVSKEHSMSELLKIISEYSGCK